MRIVYLALGFAMAAEARDCSDGGLSSRNLKIREVKIESRLNTLESIDTGLRPGDILTAESLSLAMQGIRDRVKGKIDGEADADIANRGRMQVFYISACLVAAPDNRVDVFLQPWTVSFGLPVGLPSPLNTPRSDRPSLRSNVPGPLRSLNPEFGLGYDRALDVTARGAFSTSLGELRNSAAAKPDQPRDSDVTISGTGVRSMKSENYLAQVIVDYEKRFPKASLGRLGLTSNLIASRRPIGAESWLDNAMRNGISYRTGARGNFLRGAGISAAHRWSGNRTPALSTSEQAAEVRGAIDYRIGGGYGRTLLLGDVAYPEKAASYSRFAVQSGYTTEIPFLFLCCREDGSRLSSAHTLGLDVQFTAGTSWGKLPGYAQFFGGNNDGRFVFDDSLDLQFVRPLANGPILRGYGVGQAQSALVARNARGGNGYWGINANVALPVPRWSRFLIPPDPDEDGVTIGDRIEGAGLNSSQNLLAAFYRNEEGLGDAEADAKAKADMDTVRPAVQYIARYAKIFSIRPLLMFDAAQLRGDGPFRMFYSAGCGVQLTVVTARFELGYAWAVKRHPGDPVGNVILRMTFQNLF